MKKLVKNFILVLVIFLTIAGIFTLTAEPFEKEKEIGLNQLVTAINQNQVKKITVSGNQLDISYQDQTKAISVKEPETSLSQALLNYGVDKKALSKVEVVQKEESNYQGWIWAIAIIMPLILFGLFFFMLFKRSKKGAMQAFQFTKSRAKLFGEGGKKEKITFEDVGDLKEAKEELKEVVEFLRHPKKFLKMGAKIPRGVLLMGPPGTGKTMLARAVATEGHVPFYSISGSEFTELFVGVGASRVRDLFSKAKKNQPSIIFVDELDAIGRTRGAGIGGSHDEREQTLNQILVEMDGFQRESTCLVFAATNRADVLDPALLRPGRFDRRIILTLPDISGREEILKIHCREKPLASDTDLREVAERTPGFSGADLENVVNEAAILAARKDKKKVHQTELLESIEKVLLGPERKSHILSKKEKEIAAYHEAGHALVSTFLPKGESVRKISIISRGKASGYTLKMPQEEKKIKGKSEFLSEMATLLGGYTAEKIKFKEITTGAANDLEKASKLARKLVKQYGMSSLGPVSWGEEEEKVFLGKEFAEKRNYSEKIAAKIDREVSKIVKKAQKQSQKILQKKKKLLEKLANILIEKETIERKEFEKIIKSQKKGKKPKKRKKSKTKSKKKKS